MRTELKPDICVIGAGSGGLSVAAAAAAFGVDVVLIEKGKMGGDCLNTGCVPSKALLSAAKAARSVRSAAAFGVNAKLEGIDFSKANDHVHSVIAAIEPHDSVERFEGLGVTVIKSQGHFVSPDCVVTDKHEIRARRFVVATGSTAAVPPISGLDTVPYLTNENIFELREAPAHLIIIGGGPIGLEMAQAHRRLGSRVTVIEGQKALGKDDPELAAIVLDQLRAEGVDLKEHSSVEAVEQRGEEIVVKWSSVSDITGETSGTHLLVAAGRSPNVEGVGLEAAGIDFDRRGIKVGPDLKTSNRKVYAIGDVTGGLQFTHVAGYHAGLVIRSILFRLPAKEDRSIIPWVTYTSPELGHVGLTEQEARHKHGEKVRVLSADYSGNDRARAEGISKGRLKLVVGPKGRVLGADIAGAQAGEIINLLSLAVAKKLTVKDLAGFVSPYPTLGELVRRAAISYYADLPGKPWLRKMLAVLRAFG